MSTRDFSWGKGGRCVWLTTYHPCSAESQEIRAVNLPGTPRATSACRGKLYLLLQKYCNFISTSFNKHQLSPTLSVPFQNDPSLHLHFPSHSSIVPYLLLHLFVFLLVLFYIVNFSSPCCPFGIEVKKTYHLHVFL